MSRPCVSTIVADFLKLNGYDGLFSDGCGCKVEDIMPCGDTYDDCEAGYVLPCDPEICQASGDCKWHIGPRKELV